MSTPSATPATVTLRYLKLMRRAAYRAAMAGFAGAQAVAENLDVMCQLGSEFAGPTDSRTVLPFDLLSNDERADLARALHFAQGWVTSVASAYKFHAVAGHV